jgi:hypothetical protein
VEHKRPAGLLKPLEILEWKWEHITMDFVVGLPRTLRSKDVIWFVVDRITKLAYFIPMKTTNSTEELIPLCMKKVLRLHGMPKSIVSYRDYKFVSKFGWCLHDALGTKFSLSVVFQSKHVRNRTLTLIEREDDTRSWGNFLVYFSHSTTMPCPPRGWGYILIGC